MIQDIITEELFNNKSVAAFLYLINKGRELELKFKEQTLHISRDGSQKSCSVWIGKEEQAFDSVEDLFLNGQVFEKKIYEIWADIELITLF